jgi:hypothetical protein
MKRFKALGVIIVSVSICLAVTNTAFSSNSYLPVAPVYQEDNTHSYTGDTTHWCWAASAKMILDYYALYPVLCTMVEYYASQWCSSGCHETYECETTGGYFCSGARSVHQILLDYGYNTSCYSSLNFCQFKEQIDRYVPFVVKWYRNYTGGTHNVVAVGYNDNDPQNPQVYYNDPKFGSLVSDSYESFLASSVNT